MMWLLKFGFCLIVWPSVIHGIELKDYLDRMAVKNETINNVFKLTINGLLGEGSFALVYSGARISDEWPVALKFVLMDNEKNIEQEYEMYSYLGAINNTDVERFGIPVVYYYGEWLDDFIVMALSSLEKDLFDKANEGHFVEPINNLILSRQFIIQSKYMHSHGVRHDDIKPENIMFSKHKSFLIDFNMGAKLLHKRHGGTIKYTSRRCHNLEMRYALDDWESFLYMMCDINRVNLEFLPATEVNDWHVSKNFRATGRIKADTNNTITAIKLAIASPSLRRVLLAFADEVFDDSRKKFPNYDNMYQLIQEEIEKFSKPAHLVFYTWLKPADIRRAKAEIANYPLPDVENGLIRSPHLIDFAKYAYPKPDFNKFGGLGLVKRVSTAVSDAFKFILN